MNNISDKKGRKMAIKITDIAIGYEYQAGSNQDRLVLGYTKDRRVVYAERGGNVKNPYATRQTSSKDRFAKACHCKGKKMTPAIIRQIIKNTHANTMIGK